MHTSHPGWTVGVAAVVGCLLLGTTGVAEEQGARATETIIELSQDGGSRIGVSIEDVADNDSVAEGAFIRGVSPDSPAESAGFSEGDVVVEFDGERVRSVRQLTRLVQETPVGRAVGVVVVRDGGRVELEVTPESGGLNLEQEALRFAPDAATRVDSVLRRELGPFADRHWVQRFAFAIGPAARLGVNAQELTDQLAGYFGVDDGVLISQVDEASVAAEAGLQAGDVITAVDGRAVGDVGSLRRRLSGLAPGDEVVIAITRAGSELELTATIGDARSGGRRLAFPNAGPAIC